MHLQFWIPWLGSKMLFNISGTISVLIHFPLHSSKTVLVKSDAFDKSLLVLGLLLSGLKIVGR